MAEAKPTQNIANIGGQARDIADQFVTWLRTDSLTVAIAVGVALLIYLLLEAIRHGGCRLIGRGEELHPDSWRGIIVRLLQRTNTLFVAALSAYLVTNFVAPPGSLRSAIDFIFTIAAVIQAAIWARELILGLVARRATPRDHEEHAQLASAMGVIRIIVNVAVWALAIILILDNLGVNVTALVAGLGIGGIAIGLAAQGIFSDLFAALAILFDRPFRQGDTIQWGATTGSVEAIGLKTTRVRSVSGEQVIVSNTKLLEQEIRNLRRIDERRVLFVVPLMPDTPAEKLARTPELVRAVVERQANTRFDHAVVTNVTANGFDLEVIFHMTVPDADAMAVARHGAIVGIKQAFEREDIVLADLTPPRPAEEQPPAKVSSGTAPRPLRSS